MSSHKMNLESNKVYSSYIKDYTTKLPEKSGIYQMFNKNDACLYVGKAKNLKKRVTNYIKLNRNSLRIQKMIKETYYMNHIVTKSEADALLLEANLIKSLAPKYNILLRDDKSFPYIEIDLKHSFPRLKQVKTKEISGRNLFGPFISGKLADDVIKIIQQAFKLRVCSDHSFNNRVKPCIYYQIKRCSAPCVQKISQQDYKKQTIMARNLLHGKYKVLKQQLTTLMQFASNNDNFEKAMTYRDQLNLLQTLKFNYSVILPSKVNADFFVILEQNTLCYLQVFSFLNGLPQGSLSYFATKSSDDTIENVLKSFMIQFYQKRKPPSLIYCSPLPNELPILKQILNQISGEKITIDLPSNKFKHVVDFINENAEIRLNTHNSSTQLFISGLTDLSKILGLKLPVERIEAYDNSHFQGSNSLGVMVVAGVHGLNPKEYRIFKLKNQLINSGDDLALMYEILSRRLVKLVDQPSSLYPSLLIIDGGLNQLRVAKKVLSELNLSIRSIAVKKDSKRTFGQETIITDTGKIFSLDKNNNAAFKIILKLRDEAHNFAITNQRKSGLKKINTSQLDNIKQIGAKRKQTLLKTFKSVNNLKNSTVEEISKIKGVSPSLAKKILEQLH